MTAVLWQRIEGAIFFLVSVGLGIGFLFEAPGTMPWWAAVLVFFAPDLSFFAYLAGPRVGAFFYNLWHLYATNFVLFFAAGAYAAMRFTDDAYFYLTIAILWLGHAGFDRMMGYGLKEPTGFQDTHLGRIGKK